MCVSHSSAHTVSHDLLCVSPWRRRSRAAFGSNCVSVQHCATPTETTTSQESRQLPSVQRCPSVVSLLLAKCSVDGVQDGCSKCVASTWGWHFVHWLIVAMSSVSLGTCPFRLHSIASRALPKHHFECTEDSTHDQEFLNFRCRLHDLAGPSELVSEAQQLMSSSSSLTDSPSRAST